MKDPNCPTCDRTRDRRHRLCPACWRSLPASTRGRLALRDRRAALRQQQLRAQLRDHTPVQLIRASR